MNHNEPVSGRRLRPALGRLSRHCLVTPVFAALFTGHSGFYAAAASPAELDALVWIMESLAGDLDEIVGIRQMKTSTAADKHVGITPIDTVDKNVHADEARIARARREGEQKGHDPMRWSFNVETVAAARVGGETVRCVVNINQHYRAHSRVHKNNLQRDHQVFPLEKAPQK